MNTNQRIARLTHLGRMGLFAVPLAVLAAFPARAELTLNGTFEVELARNSDTLINTKRVEGSFAGMVWHNFGAQFDLGIGKHEQYTSTSPSAGAHVFYKPSEEAAVGVYLAAEDRRPGNSYFYGVEGAYRTERYGIEGYLAMRDDIAETTTGHRVGFDATYSFADLSQLSVLTGAVYDDGGPLERGYGYVGASYEISDGFALGGTVGRTDNGATVAAISATLTFGKGSTFGRRDSFGLYPGY